MTEGSAAAIVERSMSGDTIPLQGRARPAADLSCYLSKVELMAKIVWKQYGERLQEHLEFRDLYQHGVIVMLEIARNYDPAGGASLQTYIGNRVHGAMLDYFFDDHVIPIYKTSRGDRPRHRFIPLDAFDHPSISQQPYDTKLISTMLATLHERELRMVYMRWYEDRTLQDIGDTLGITAGRRIAVVYNNQGRRESVEVCALSRCR